VSARERRDTVVSARTKFVFCALASIAPILAAELYVRGLDRRKTPRMEVGPQPSQASPDARIGWENRPGATQTHRYFNRDGTLRREIRIVINAQGFRGKEVEARKPAGTYRIVAIGDSQTYGSGVDEEEAWPVVLQGELAHAADGVRVEVMNCGVGGYNTGQEVAALETHWLAYEPDLVLLGFFVNDPIVVEPGPESGAPPPNPGAQSPNMVGAKSPSTAGADAPTTPGGEARSGAWLRVFARGRPGFLGWLRKRSQLVDYLCDGAYSRLLVREWMRGGEAIFSDDNPGFADACHEIARARDLCAARGARFAVVLLPFLVRWGGGVISTKLYARVAAYCREKGIECVDLEPAFAGMAVDALRVHERDWHTGPEGHRIQAAALARWLLSSGPLARSSAAK